MAKRLEFSKAVKAQRFAHCGGRCEKCGDKLFYVEYDHDLPAGLNGGATFENCRCLCRECHYLKTHGKEGDRYVMRKADRVRAKHTGTRQKSKAVMAGTRRSRWKKKLNGKTERRDD